MEGQSNKREETEKILKIAIPLIKCKMLYTCQNFLFKFQFCIKLVSFLSVGTTVPS